MNVLLPPTEQQFVKELVASGRYRSERDVIRASLRLLKEQENGLEPELQEFRRKALAGLEQCKQGRVIDGDEAFARVGRRAVKRKKRAQA